jgi:hypothetical protein
VPRGATLAELRGAADVHDVRALARVTDGESETPTGLDISASDLSELAQHELVYAFLLSLAS